jgi:hypothetical protein
MGHGPYSARTCNSLKIENIFSFDGLNAKPWPVSLLALEFTSDSSNQNGRGSLAL